MLNGQRHYTVDSATCESIVTLPDEQMTVTDVDEPVDWDRVSTTTLDEHYASFFDTDAFHKLDVTVATEMDQPYVIHGDEYTFRKEADELATAAWSLDNKPLTIDHPSIGRVTRTDEIHGVFNNPSFDWSKNALTADLFIPVTDTIAHQNIQETDNVSIGFYNQLDADVSDDGIDAIQRDIYIDHVSSVDTGRCSDGDGCKIRV